jgi:hypothetical protein
MFDIDDTLIFTSGRPNDPIIELLNDSCLYEDTKLSSSQLDPVWNMLSVGPFKQLREYGIPVQLFRIYEYRNKHLHEKTITL